MIVEVTYSYYELGVVPPRCRKPRDVARVGTTTVLVPEVSGDQAPVAFRYGWSADDGPADEYRWWEDTLWELYWPWAHQSEPSVPGTAHFPAKLHVGNGWDWQGQPLDQGAALADVPRRFGGFLIVDGAVWRTAGEPRYEVYTMGLGHNHGGSGLGVATHYNGNIARGRYFRADQAVEAKTEAVRVAIARGDTDSVPRIERAILIEVLIPEAVRCHPEVEAGEGDPFLNQLYSISEGSASAAEAGVLTLLLGVTAASGN